jgi:hypothetical protein
MLDSWHVFEPQPCGETDYSFLSLTLLLAASCARTSIPEKGSDAITLMTKYNNAARYDDAIGLAQEWLKRNPEDPSQNGRFYEQIAITYLLKAANVQSNS